MQSNKLDEGYIRQQIVNYFNRHPDINKVFKEFKIGKRGRVDVVVVQFYRIPNIIIIEAKSSAKDVNARAIQQIKTYSEFSHYTFLALSENECSRKMVELCLSLGVGLYSVKERIGGGKISLQVFVEPEKNENPLVWPELLRVLKKEGIDVSRMRKISKYYE